MCIRDRHLPGPQAELEELEAAFGALGDFQVAEGGEVGAIYADYHSFLVVLEPEGESSEDYLVDEGDVEAEGHEL